MNWFDRLVDWWWDMRNLSDNVGNEEWHSSFPAIPDDLECPDTQPTSPGALDSDHARLE